MGTSDAAKEQSMVHTLALLPVLRGCRVRREIGELEQVR